ncbi:MAG: hypothetical protein HOC70_08905 [Gammaproteobacteria bacterium]|jgi:hypothetical protein|nr:hypothetical protein [Gammaproteobacteria bacterium]MBT4493352.1 hypothetical protein [Gammaproteobacteria bacterium]MBT7371526.1 hypothetical protein [Gammaproteobacteria bacterium]
MNRIRVFTFMILLIAAPSGFAAEEWVEKEGVVREIDLATRTAIISGFRYYFGTSGGYQTPDMELIYYPTASFEMLEVDMKVQFHFTPEKPLRRILRLRQLANDAWLDNKELPDAIPEDPE